VTWLRRIADESDIPEDHEWQRTSKKEAQRPTSGMRSTTSARCGKLAIHVFLSTGLARPTISRAGQQR